MYRTRKNEGTNQRSGYASYRTTSHHIASKDLQNLKRELMSQFAGDDVTTIIEGMRIAVVIDKRTKNNGRNAVKIRIRYRDNSAYIPLGVDVRPQDFLNGRAIGRSAGLVNSVIDDYLQRAQAVIKALIENNLIDQFGTAVELKDYVAEAISAKEEDNIDPSTSSLFIVRLNNYKKGRKPGYAASFEDTLRKVEQFTDIEGLKLEDITVSWLKDFEKFCYSTGMKENGVAHYLRNIRTIFNDAIDREIMDINSYPFRRFKIKKAPTAHRALTVEELQNIINFDVDAYHASSSYKTMDVRRAIDLFMLSFYFGGVNIRDLVLATEDDFRAGRFVTMREKTGEPISLAIQPEAQEIIDRHRGNKYHLDFLDDYSKDDAKNLTRVINKALKVIDDKLSTYWARHTWATIAGELDIPDAVIDMAQGRKPSGVTAVYVKRNTAKADAANRKVIDHIKK